MSEIPSDPREARRYLAEVAKSSSVELSSYLEDRLLGRPVPPPLSTRDLEDPADFLRVASDMDTALGRAIGDAADQLLFEWSGSAADPEQIRAMNRALGLCAHMGSLRPLTLSALILRARQMPPEDSDLEIALHENLLAYFEARTVPPELKAEAVDIALACLASERLVFRAVIALVALGRKEDALPFVDQALRSPHGNVYARKRLQSLLAGSLGTPPERRI